MTDAGEGTTAHLVELVLDVAGPVHAVEPVMRLLRRRLESVGPGDFARQIGTHVSQEFGSLTCTVRAVVDEVDLLRATEVAVCGIRPLVALALLEQDQVPVRETAVHARLL